MNDILVGSVGTMAVAGLLIWIFKKSISAALHRDVLRDVEKLKSELELKKETIKHDLQKELFSDELLINKKHEVYARLLELVRIAHGAVANLHGISFQRTYEECDEEDLAEVLKEYKVPNGEAQKILQLFRSGREDGKPASVNPGLDEWKKYKRVLDIGTANGNVTDANNYWVINELYMSEEVFDKCKQIIVGLKGLLMDTRFEEDAKKCRTSTPNPFKSEREINSLIDELVVIMKSDLKHKCKESTDE